MNGEHCTIEQMLAEYGVYAGPVKGVSMEPLLREQRDIVVIKRARGRLRENDVPLYRQGDRYVLHRIIKVLPDSYVIRGDNCIRKERGITDADIVGVLTEYSRKGKHCSVSDPDYLRYVKRVRLSFPLRAGYYRLRGIAARLWNGIKK